MAVQLRILSEAWGTLTHSSSDPKTSHPDDLLPTESSLTPEESSCPHCSIWSWKFLICSRSPSSFMLWVSLVGTCLCGGWRGSRRVIRFSGVWRICVGGTSRSRWRQRVSPGSSLHSTLMTRSLVQVITRLMTDLTLIWHLLKGMGSVLVYSAVWAIEHYFSKNSALLSQS